VARDRHPGDAKGADCDVIVGSLRLKHAIEVAHDRFIGAGWRQHRGHPQVDAGEADFMHPNLTDQQRQEIQAGVRSADRDERHRPIGTEKLDLLEQHPSGGIKIARPKRAVISEAASRRSMARRAKSGSSSSRRVTTQTCSPSPAINTSQTTQLATNSAAEVHQRKPNHSDRFRLMAWFWRRKFPRDGQRLHSFP